jgi:hypothetical protein
MANGEDRTAYYDTSTGVSYTSLEEYNKAKGRT